MPAPKDPEKYKLWKQHMSEVRSGNKNTWFGKHLPQETRDKLSKSCEGRIPWNKGLSASEASKKKMSKSHSNKKLTESHKTNIGKSIKGIKRNETTKEKIRYSRMGKKATEKTLLKMREINIGKTASIETKEKMSKSHLGENNYNYNKPMNYEQRLKLVENALGGIWYGNVRYYQGPQYCEKFNEEFKERVRAYFNYTCPECETPQGSGKKLAVHHVNFNKKSCCDPNAPRLFVPLCADSCHLKTNHNREYWEKYFTEIIMNYYQGKCYFTKEEMKIFKQF